MLLLLLLLSNAKTAMPAGMQYLAPLASSCQQYCNVNSTCSTAAADYLALTSNVLPLSLSSFSPSICCC
jgi:hypothetical protein